MKQCELWTPRYFRWLFLHNLFRSLEIPLGVLRGSALLNVFIGWAERRSAMGSSCIRWRCMTCIGFRSAITPL